MWQLLSVVLLAQFRQAALEMLDTSGSRCSSRSSVSALIKSLQSQPSGKQLHMEVVKQEDEQQRG